MKSRYHSLILYIEHYFSWKSLNNIYRWRECMLLQRRQLWKKPFEKIQYLNALLRIFWISRNVDALWMWKELWWQSSMRTRNVKSLPPNSILCHEHYVTCLELVFTIVKAEKTVFQTLEMANHSSLFTSHLVSAYSTHTRLLYFTVDTNASHKRNSSHVTIVALADPIKNLCDISVSNAVSKWNFQWMFYIRIVLRTSCPWDIDCLVAYFLKGNHISELISMRDFEIASLERISEIRKFMSANLSAKEILWTLFIAWSLSKCVHFHHCELFLMRFIRVVWRSCDFVLPD